MNYQQARTWIDSRQRFGVNPGLERIAALCRLLGDPQKKLRFVHVAGTNGKGSTCSMLASVLSCAGYKTGLYISPYVVDFLERIQIDGRCVTKKRFASVASDVAEKVSVLDQKGLCATEFEVITATAFAVFRQAGCDIVVLETGLGGRFDATNVIERALVNIIASVSMDHCDILGSTIEQIAFEKAGIIKPGTKTVCYAEMNPKALKVITKAALACGSEYYQPDAAGMRVISEDINSTVIETDGMDIRVPFAGRHMALNTLSVIQAAQLLREEGFRLSDTMIVQGIEKTHMPARMEIVCNNPLTIIEGGHNEECAQALAQCIKKYLPGKKITAVFAMMSDKDIDAYLALTTPLFHRMIVTRPRLDRAQTPEFIALKAAAYCSDITVCRSSARAMRSVVFGATGSDDAVIVCGSFYLASEARAWMMKYKRNEDLIDNG